MGVLESISGVLLILCSIAIIVMVLFQESKGNGLSGAIAGCYFWQNCIVMAESSCCKFIMQSFLDDPVNLKIRISSDR